MVLQHQRRRRRRRLAITLSPSLQFAFRFGLIVDDDEAAAAAAVGGFDLIRPEGEGPYEVVVVVVDDVGIVVGPSYLLLATADLFIKKMTRAKWL